MGKSFRQYDPEQVLMLPPSIEDWLPDGHLARFVSDVVEELDLSEIQSSYDAKDGRGQAAYHPLMMVKVLLYGYCLGIVSSRKLERATHENVAFRYLSANQHPDHDTIAEFRRRHLSALSGLFLQGLRLCKQAGLVKLGHVALDGTKIQANASLYKNRTYEKLSEQERQLVQQVEQMLAEAEQVDGAEDEKYGPGKRGDELPPKLAEKQNRLATIREAKAELERQAKEAAEREKAAAEQRLREREQREAEAGRTLPGRRPQVPEVPAEPDPKAKINLTDPDSRIMGQRGKGFVQAFNAQAAVDREKQIIVAADVTQDGHDRVQLVPMLEQVKQNNGAKPEQVSADTGYYSPTQVASPSVADIDLYIPPDEPPKKKEEAATEVGESQELASAEGPDEPPNKKEEAATGVGESQEPPSVEVPRPNRKKPRSGYGPDGMPRIEHLRQKLRTPEGKAIYAKRRETVEPVFGQIKERRGFRRFLLRGVDKVRAEWRIICLTHNLLKLYRATWARQAA